MAIKLGVSDIEMDILDSFAHEETELHGNDDVVLYVPHYVDNQANHDPMYGEPIQNSYIYTKYFIKGHYRDFSTQEIVGEGGESTEWTQTLEVTKKHLEVANVPMDTHYVGRIFTNAVVSIMILGIEEFFDIVQVENNGVSTRTGGFTHIICDLKQNTKFNPSRKIGDNE